MRWLLALLALVAIPAQAQVAPDGRFDGVWTGTLGTQPIHACLVWRDWRGDGELSGAYYYDRYLAPIRLAGDAQGLAEEPRFLEPSGDRWSIARIDAQGMVGTWRGANGRTLPLQLTKLDRSPANISPDNPCGSLAFFAPRLAGSSWTEERAVANGQGYTIRSYVPPPLFQPTEDGFAPLGFTVLRMDETQPGDGPINAQFAVISSDQAIADCFATTLSEFGSDGDLWEFHTLDQITPHWLGISIGASNFCGGAHPNHALFHRIYDRQTGAQVQPGDWLGPEAVERVWSESEGERLFYDLLTPAFRAKLVTHWPHEDDPDSAECASFVGDEQFWDMGLTANGLKFTPQLPHVIMACSDTVELPWAELAPFLNDQGRAVMAELSAP